MKKILSFCLVTILLLAGCSTGSKNALYTDDKAIASDTNNFNLNKEEQKIEGQTFTGKVEFEGMDTIWVYEAKEDLELNIAYTLKLAKGIAKLVLISPDGTLTPIVEVSDKATELDQLAKSPLPLKTGENRIKLVAKDKAEIEFEISIEEGEFSKLGL